MDVFERLGLGRLIDSSLGKRDASWNAFRYSEVIECSGGVESNSGGVESNSGQSLSPTPQIHVPLQNVKM